MCVPERGRPGRAGHAHTRNFGYASSKERRFAPARLSSLFTPKSSFAAKILLSEMTPARPVVVDLF
jgi:hypothetical protein